MEKDTTNTMSTGDGPAIRVKINEIGFIALLNDSYEYNTISRGILRKTGTKDLRAGENVILDVNIDGRLMLVTFQVLGKCSARGGKKLALGKDFLNSVKAYIHFDLGILQWLYQDESLMEIMVTDIIFKDGSKRKTLKRALKTRSATVEKNSIEDVVKIYIMSEICELLDSEVKTPIGYYLEAVKYAVDAAKKQELKNVHIVVDDERVVDIMTQFINHYEKYGTKDNDVPKFLHLLLHRPADFQNYFAACDAIQNLQGFESIHFEFGPSESVVSN